MNFLVETKNEYTIQLINIISPHIYIGFDFIYNESKNLIQRGEESLILKTFQQFLKKIPMWNIDLIDNEVIRIKNNSKCEFLEDLVKAVVKSNIVLLGNNKIIDNEIENIISSINLNNFIHKCYIECARQFYISPYLFYHDLKPIDKKRNQRDCYEIIKQSIKEGIRKMLPVKLILKEYLGNDYNDNTMNLEKNISFEESENLKKIINIDLNRNKNNSSQDNKYSSKSEKCKNNSSQDNKYFSKSEKYKDNYSQDSKYFNKSEKYNKSIKNSENNKIDLMKNNENNVIDSNTENNVIDSNKNIENNIIELIKNNENNKIDSNKNTENNVIYSNKNNENENNIIDSIKNYENEYSDSNLFKNNVNNDDINNDIDNNSDSSEETIKLLSEIKKNILSKDDSGNDLYENVFTNDGINETENSNIRNRNNYFAKFNNI